MISNILSVDSKNMTVKRCRKYLAVSKDFCYAIHKYIGNKYPLDVPHEYNNEEKHF